MMAWTGWTNFMASSFPQYNTFEFFSFRATWRSKSVVQKLLIWMNSVCRSQM